jgi:chaperonin GroEL (HSP60 family)
MESKVVLNNYQQLDRILKQEQMYILNMCKQIKKTGCNVLCIQKSILRDSVNDYSLQFLAKLGIMVIKDIERDEIEFISKVTRLVVLYLLISRHSDVFPSLPLKPSARRSLDLLVWSKKFPPLVARYAQKIPSWRPTPEFS